MLVELLLVYCTNHFIQFTEATDPVLSNVYPSQSSVQNFVPESPDTATDAKVPIRSIVVPQSPTICPANEVLLRIEDILTNLLKKDETSNKYENDNGFDIQLGDQKHSIGRSMKSETETEIPLNPLSKAKSLRELVSNGNLKGNIKTKILVQYEIPNESEANCIDALSKILQILKNSNLFPKNENGILIAKDRNEQEKYQNEDNANLDVGKLINSNNNDMLSLLKQYGTKKQIKNTVDVNNIPAEINHVTPWLNTISSQKSIQDLTLNIPSNNPLYQLNVTKKHISTDTPNVTNRNTNSIENKPEKLDEKVSLQSLVQSNTEASKPDDVLVTVTNDGRVVAIDQTKPNAEIESVNNFNRNGQNLPNKLTRERVNAMLQMLESGDDKVNFLTGLLQPNNQHKKSLQQVPVYINSNVMPYLNPNQMNSKFKIFPVTNVPSINSLHQTPNLNMLYQYYKNKIPSDNIISNINGVNKLTNQGNVNGKPYYVNSDLADYSQHGNQLHSTNNLENLERLIGVTDQIKLNSEPGNTGVVELTYMLKRPKPVVYQPVYFVKYRLPYESFVNNLKDLLQRKPNLRSDPDKLYQELINASKVAEVSPKLKGVDQKKLLNMIASNGALVKTKILKVNETNLDKQLEILRNMNANLTANDLSNATYSLQNETRKKSDLLGNEIEEAIINQTNVTESKNASETKLAPAIFFPYKMSNNNDNTTELSSSPPKEFLLETK